MIMYMSYGTTLYRSKSLKKAVASYRTTLNKILRKDPRVIGLISTGSSGSILASNLLCGELERDLCYLHVNKPDSGHGHDGVFSGRYSYEVGVYVFVDDFICDGYSLKRCWNAIKNEHKQNRIQLRYALVARGNSRPHGCIKIVHVDGWR